MAKDYFGKVDRIHNIPVEQTTAFLQQETATEKPEVKIEDSKMMFLEKDNPSIKLIFHLNPENSSWTDNRSTSYSTEDVSEWNSERPQYDNTNMRVISFTLRFDDTVATGNPKLLTTQNAIEWLRLKSMTIPDSEMYSKPPVLLFTGEHTHMLTKKLFTCVLTKVNVVPLWRDKLTPFNIRKANVAVTLKEFLEYES